MMISGLVSGYFIEAVLTQFSLQQVPVEPHYFQGKRNQKRVLAVRRLLRPSSLHEKRENFVTRHLTIWTVTSKICICASIIIQPFLFSKLEKFQVQFAKINT